MGNAASFTSHLITFEDVQHLLVPQSHTTSYLLINTLPRHEQACLLPTTVNVDQEESVVNDCLSTRRAAHTHLVIYGKNCLDDSIYAKRAQCAALGFARVSVYAGGLFEWLLLQDVYGANAFPTTAKELDLLRFKPAARIR